MAAASIKRVKKNAQTLFGQFIGPKSDGAVYAILSQGAALAQTMTPVDSSNLINSQYAPQIKSENGKTSGHIGYTAEYALAVHDASGTLAGTARENGNGNYWDPAGEPKFLNKGFEEVEPSIPNILRSYYRV